MATISHRDREQTVKSIKKTTRPLKELDLKEKVASKEEAHKWLETAVPGVTPVPPEIWNYGLSWCAAHLKDLEELSREMESVIKNQ